MLNLQGNHAFYVRYFSERRCLKLAHEFMHATDTLFSDFSPSSIECIRDLFLNVV